jgi:phosphatidylethanolamine-binding protein (PEBP) family uncharacterized protein
MQTKKAKRRSQTAKRKRLKKQHAGDAFSISYNGIQVRGQRLTKEQTSEKPAVQIPAGFYIVMYDPDAPARDWIHWIATNKEDILPYEGPQPPPGTGVHRYMFALVAGNPPLAPPSRGDQNASRIAPLSKRVTIAEFIVASK